MRHFQILFRYCHLTASHTLALYTSVPIPATSSPSPAALSLVVAGFGEAIGVIVLVGAVNVAVAVDVGNGPNVVPDGLGESVTGTGRVRVTTGGTRPGVSVTGMDDGDGLGTDVAGMVVGTAVALGVGVALAATVGVAVKNATIVGVGTLAVGTGSHGSLRHGKVVLVGLREGGTAVRVDGNGVEVGVVAVVEVVDEVGTDVGLGHEKLTFWIAEIGPPSVDDWPRYANPGMANTCHLSIGPQLIRGFGIALQTYHCCSHTDS